MHGRAGSAYADCRRVFIPPRWLTRRHIQVKCISSPGWAAWDCINTQFSDSLTSRDCRSVGQPVGQLACPPRWQQQIQRCACMCIDMAFVAIPSVGIPRGVDNGEAQGGRCGLAAHCSAGACACQRYWTLCCLLSKPFRAGGRHRMRVAGLCPPSQEPIYSRGAHGERVFSKGRRSRRDSQLLVKLGTAAATANPDLPAPRSLG